MSWNGAHPTISKREARALLPPRACKDCVHLVRCFPTLMERQEYFGDTYYKCARCGTYPCCSRDGQPRPPRAQLSFLDRLAMPMPVRSVYASEAVPRVCSACGWRGRGRLGEPCPSCGATQCRCAACPVTP